MTNNVVELDFQEMVANLAKNGQEIVESLNAQKAHILHMAIGISGEAGEILSGVKGNNTITEQLSNSIPKRPIAIFKNFIFTSIAVSLEETEMVTSIKKSDIEFMIANDKTSEAGFAFKYVDEVNQEYLKKIYIAMDITISASNLLDLIKKYVVYGKEIDIKNIIEELGDMEFYMEGLRKAFNITREDTLIENIKKLGTRYGQGKYSDLDAQVRADKIGEK